jgi:DNA-directed RNA polymerase specialized sigma24 family protein
MSSFGSVTHWIGQLKGGDSEAAQKLWDRYFQKLVRFARRKLQHSRRRAADEEDVALSAFQSFCRRASQGRFPGLDDRNNLWRLLVVITARRAWDLMESERCQKRGGGKVSGESVLMQKAGATNSDKGMGDVVGDEPTPEFAAQVAEEFQRLLDQLESAELRAVAIWKMEGFTNGEIAAKLGCVEGTVERRLRVIRTIWKKTGSQP